MGDLLPSVLPSIHFGFSNFYIPSVLYGQNTRSAGEFPSQPRCAEPVEASDFVYRSEAKLYRGGRSAALDTPSTSFQALGQRLSNQANRVNRKPAEWPTQEAVSRLAYCTHNNKLLSSGNLTLNAL